MPNVQPYSYTIPNSQQQALMMPMPQDNVGGGGQTGGYQTGNGMMGLSPQMLQSLMGSGASGVDPSLANATLNNGQGPTMQNYANLMGITDPNATAGQNFNSIQNLTNQNNPIPSVANNPIFNIPGYGMGSY